MIKTNAYLIILLLVFSIPVFTQEQEKADTAIVSAKKTKISPKIDIIQNLQLWNIYSIESFSDNSEHSRNDIYIRRGRLGFKGKINDDISVVLMLAYDGIGRDKRTAGNGSPNPDDNHDFYLWDGFLTYKINPLLNITAGYFRPQVGRENITAAFRVISFEKSLLNFQTRSHFLGRSTGRETGINIGGFKKGSLFNLNYNVGFFDPSSEKIVGKGSRWFPMVTGRLAIGIGDPEMEKYKLGYVQSYYGKRKGITLGLNGSYQGETEVFTANSFYGADILANWGKIDFVAEYGWLYRNSFTENGSATVATTDHLYSVKLGYNFILPNGKIIQPSVMYSVEMADNDDTVNSGKNSLTGSVDQDAYDLGVNYLLNKDNLKLSLHYLWGNKYLTENEDSYNFVAAGLQYLF